MLELLSGLVNMAWEYNDAYTELVVTILEEAKVIGTAESTFIFTSSNAARAFVDGLTIGANIGNHYARRR